MFILFLEYYYCLYYDENVNQTIYQSVYTFPIKGLMEFTINVSIITNIVYVHMCIVNTIYIAIYINIIIM